MWSVEYLVSHLQRYPALISGTCELVDITSHGKKNFADLVKDFDIERLSYIIHVAQSNHMGLYKWTSFLTVVREQSVTLE